MTPKRLIAILLVTVLTLTAAASCDILGDIADALQSSDFTTYVSQTGDKAVEGASTATSADEYVTESADAISFHGMPELIEYTMPSEDFVDDFEREASEIIDEAIEKAISCVLTPAFYRPVFS